MDEEDETKCKLENDSKSSDCNESEENKMAAKIYKIKGNFVDTINRVYIRPEKLVYSVIVPPGYKLEELRNMIQKTSIKDQCEFVKTETDIDVLCDGFIQLFQRPKSIKDMAALCTAAYMMYMIKPYSSYTTLPCRIHLINRAFQEADTLWPYHIHYIVDKMLTHLKVDDDIDGYFLNLIHGLPRLAASSETGKLAAIGIARFLIAQKCGKQIKLHCFKGHSELLDMLKMIDVYKFTQSESLTSMYVLVHSLGFLLSAVAFSSNECFMQCGYRNMKLTLTESKKLYATVNKLLKVLEETAQEDIASGRSDVIMHINRFIMHSILNNLDPDDTAFPMPLF